MKKFNEMVDEIYQNAQHRLKYVSLANDRVRVMVEMKAELEAMKQVYELLYGPLERSGNTFDQHLKARG